MLTASIHVARRCARASPRADSSTAESAMHHSGRRRRSVSVRGRTHCSHSQYSTWHFTVGRTLGVRHPLPAVAASPLESVASKYQDFDRGLTEGQLKLSKPVRDAQQQAKASLQESLDAAAAKFDKIDRCVPGKGGCELDVGKSVPSWEGIACQNVATILGEGRAERAVSLKDFTSRGL